jgi:MFS family permease
MILLRLLGIGAVYGVGFMFVKSLFPEPFVLLILQGGQSSEGDLTTLALVYMGVGLLAGLIAGPIFGGALLLRRGSSERSEGSGPRFVLSLALALLTGFISGVLTLIVYAAGILPGGGVLDPLRLIEGSNHPPGVPLLVAWTIARDLLPAGLAGLFLAPLAGGALQRLYAAERPPEQKRYSWEDT